MKNAPVKVGLLTAIAIVIANMVGTGVFGSLGFQVAGLPSGFPVLLLWAIGGIVAFCGAVSYAEIASMFPRSGGEYHLINETWNPLLGFLAGWISVTVGFAAPVALNASLMGSYLGDVFAIDREIALGSWKIPVPVLAISLPTVAAVTLVHLGRVGFIGSFQQIFTYGKVVLIFLLGTLCFALGTGQDVSFLPVAGDWELIQSESFAISLAFIFYAYSGWNAAVYMMDEVEKPERNVPLALLVGTIFVTGLYLFVNAAFLHSTPIEDMAGQPEVGLVAAEHVLGERGGKAMGILISFGLISSISSMVWAGPRVSAAMGRDHGKFAWLARTNANGVPSVAILVQSAVVVILLLTATFEQMIHYVQALLTISSLLVVAGLFLLRAKRPDAERPYRAWGYPVTPALFLLTSLYFLWFQIKNKPTEFLFGLITLAVGLVVYWSLSSRKNPKTGQSS